MGEAVERVRAYMRKVHGKQVRVRAYTRKAPGKRLSPDQFEALYAKYHPDSTVDVEQFGLRRHPGDVPHAKTLDFGRATEQDVAVSAIQVHQTQVTVGGVGYYLHGGTSYEADLLGDGEPGQRDLIQVTPHGAGYYLIDGTHRLAADSLLGRKTIRARVVPARKP